MDILKRSITILFCTVFLVMSFPLPANAGETTLTTVVPERITLRLEISGSGKVGYQETYYTKSGSIDLQRNTEAVFSILPARGYEIDSISLNGRKQSALLHGNLIRLTGIKPNSTLKVVFVPTGDNPLTGDFTPIAFYAMTALLSLLAMLLLWKKRIR